jgi:CBS domain-containing protein
LHDVRKVPRSDWDATLVRGVMTTADKLDLVSPQDDVSDALTKLSNRDFRQMPVVEDGHLVGMLRRRDIIRWLQMHSNMVSNSR